MHVNQEVMNPNPVDILQVEDNINKCYAPGVNSHIVKPVNFERFTEAMRHPGFYWLLLNQIPKTG